MVVGDAPRLGACRSRLLAARRACHLVDVCGVRPGVRVLEHHPVPGIFGQGQGFACRRLVNACSATQDFEAAPWAAGGVVVDAGFLHGIAARIDDCRGNRTQAVAVCGVARGELLRHAELHSVDVAYRVCPVRHLEAIADRNCRSQLRDHRPCHRHGRESEEHRHEPAKRVGTLPRDPQPTAGFGRSLCVRPVSRGRRVAIFARPVASLAFHACVALFHRQLLSCRLNAVAALFGVLRRVPSFHSGRVPAAAPSGVSQGVHVGSRSCVAGRAAAPRASRPLSGPAGRDDVWGGGRASRLSAVATRTSRMRAAAGPRLRRAGAWGDARCEARRCKRRGQEP